MAEKDKDKEPKKFEEALAELEQVVRKLESGEATLDKSLDLFERGVALAGFCHKKLEEAQKRIEIASKGEGGKVVLAPFETDEEEDD